MGGAYTFDITVDMPGIRRDTGHKPRLVGYAQDNTVDQKYAAGLMYEYRSIPPIR
jgi:hypothetical protein